MHCLRTGARVALLSFYSASFRGLANIPHRVNVRGTLDGRWGPLPNHFGEPVLGAALTSGRAHVALEESQPGAAPGLHEVDTGPVLVRGALPGAWRGHRACTPMLARPSMPMSLRRK